MPVDRGNIRYFLPRWETMLLVDVIDQVGEAMRANDRAFGTQPVDLSQREYHEVFSLPKPGRKPAHAEGDGAET